MLAIPLMLVVIVWYLVLCLRWKKNIFDLLEKIPGNKWYPVLGTFYSFGWCSRKEILYKFCDVSQKFSPFYRSWSGSVPEVHLMKPEHIQVVLRSSTHTPKGPFYQYLFPWLDEGVFLAEGAKWFMQRKMLTPAFHFKMLEGFVEIFGKRGAQFTQFLQSKANGQFFDIQPDIHVSTLGVICETSMGVPLDVLTDKPLDYVQNVHDVTEIAMWRYWRPWINDTIFSFIPQGKRHSRIVKELHAFSDKVVHYRKILARNDQELNECLDDSEKRKRLSFIDLILDATNNQQIMSHSDMKAIVDTFLLAGFETTGNTLAYALFLLGNNPEAQEKVAEEARRVLKGKDAPTTIAEVNEMRYIECVVKETMRLYPIFPFITRRTTEEIEIDGQKIPTGTQAIAHIFGTQRNPEIYPDPEKFEPERFTPENSKARHPFAYIPFSAGPRNCLGMRFALTELKTMVATIVNKYKITSLETAQDLRLFLDVFIRPQTGIRVKLELRD